MKPTRKVFALQGTNESVQSVLNGLIGFKAVMVIVSNVTMDIINKVFSKNKSVVCKMTELPVKVNSTNVIPVYVTDSTSTKIYGVTDIINANGNIVRQFMEIAEAHDIDIGDHVSNASDKSPSKEDCLFCKLLAGNPVHEQASLYETDNFLVIPGSGAFIDGYLMILPKAHVMSCAELDENVRAEMLEVIADVKQLLEGMYGTNVLVWENGSGMDGKGKPKTSIVHAHIHACPSNINIVDTTYATGIPVNPIEFNTLPKYSTDSYLLIMDYDNNWYISSDPELYIPRQYVRQLIALEHNITSELWNWRRFPFWDNVVKTGEIFINYVKAHQNNLNDRIKQATKKFI